MATVAMDAPVTLVTTRGEAWGNFVAVPSVLLDASDLTSDDKVLLQVLIKHYIDAPAAFPSQKTLARWANMPLSTVKRRLKVLERDGWIARTPRMRPDGSRTSDLFDMAVLKNRLNTLERSRRPGSLPTSPPVDLTPAPPVNLSPQEIENDDPKESAARARARAQAAVKQLIDWVAHQPLVIDAGCEVHVEHAQNQADLQLDDVDPRGLDALASYIERGESSSPPPPELRRVVITPVVENVVSATVFSDRVGLWQLADAISSPKTRSPDPFVEVVWDAIKRESLVALVDRARLAIAEDGTYDAVEADVDAIRVTLEEHAEPAALGADVRATRHLVEYIDGLDDEWSLRQPLDGLLRTLLQREALEAAGQGALLAS